MIFNFGGFLFNEKRISEVSIDTDYARGFNERLNNYEAVFKNQKTKQTIEIKGKTIPLHDGIYSLDKLKALAESDEAQVLTNALGDYFGLFVVVSLQEVRSSYAPNGMHLAEEFTLILKKVGE
ncbi:phage tail protein [Campylobacter sp. RM12637]|uniref:phage tail protein n=1 Tax=Campylobacter sp. RM12637 TaxID=2735734 RepID=UPI003014E0B0|nr:phage tail protein [Campylobacter sp. RM12637]